MPRFVVVLPLVPLTEGDEFTVADWPLHVTLVEPFQADVAGEEVAGILAGVEGIGSGGSPVRATAGDEAMFGRRGDVPVTLVHDAGELAALRGRAMRGLAAAGIDVRARLDFRPH